MDVNEVCDILNTCATHPGYRITADVVTEPAFTFDRDTGDMVDAGDIVFAHIALWADVRESSPEYAPHYSEPRADDRTVVDNLHGDQQATDGHVGPDLYANWETPADVFAWVMVNMIIPTLAHEWREFFRVLDDRGNYVAPLHPHRHDGNSAWAVSGGHAMPAAPNTYLALLGSNV